MEILIQSPIYDRNSEESAGGGVERVELTVEASALAGCPGRRRGCSLPIRIEPLLTAKLRYA